MAVEFDEVIADLKLAAGYLSRAWLKFMEIMPPDEERESTAQYGDVVPYLGIIRDDGRWFMGLIMQKHINRGNFSDPADATDYEVKKSVMREINDHLKELPAAIAHPETGEPCNLYVVGSADKTGRYVLENRKTKKRSHASRTLSEMLPIRLTAEDGKPYDNRRPQPHRIKDINAPVYRSSVG